MTAEVAWHHTITNDVVDKPLSYTVHDGKG